MITKETEPSTLVGLKGLFNNLTDSANVFPAAYVYQAEKGYTLEVELPGVKKEAVSIEVDRNILTIKGTRKRGEAETNYERSFRVNEEIDIESVTAVMEDGVLSLSLSKKKEAEAKKIVIQ